MFENKEEITELYQSGMSALEISRLFGVCRDTIYAYLKLWGIDMRKNSSGWNKPVGYNRVHERNSNFFCFPSPQNSYWAGFIAADGNITEDNSLRIGLDCRDIGLLNRFKEEIEYSGNIKIYKKKIGRPYCRIEIFDNQIVSDLRENWNITQRKTKTLIPPNIDEEDNIMAFIIGYIDGDGNIGKRENKQVQICGTIELLSWMKNVLIKFCNCEFKNNIYKTRGIYTFSFVGKNSDKFFEWCKKYNGYKLERKWK